MTSFKWPPSGGGSGVDTYPTFAAFPVSAADGTLALALDTRILYEYSTTAMNWAAIGGPGVALSVGTIDSQPKVADGLQIVGSDIIPQTVDSTYPGLMTSADYDLLQTAWVYAGNAGTTPGTDFIGTSDAQNLQIQTNGQLQVTYLATGGWGSAQSVVPVDAVSKNQYELVTSVEPTVTTTTANNAGIRSVLSYDFADGGFDFGGTLTAASLRAEHLGSGNAAFLGSMDASGYLGNAGGSTALVKNINSENSVVSGHNVSVYYGMFSALNTTGATLGGGSAYGSGVSLADVTAGSYSSESNSLNISGTSTFSGGVEGISGSITLSDTTTVSNQTIGVNYSVTAEDTSVLNYMQGANINLLALNGTDIGSVTVINTGLTVENTADVGSVIGVNTNFQFNDSCVGLGVNNGNFNATFSDSSVFSSYVGVNANSTFQGSSQVANVQGGNILTTVSATADVDNLLGFGVTASHSGSVAITNVGGLNVSVQLSGTAPTNPPYAASFSYGGGALLSGVTGLDVNLSGATLSAAAIAAGTTKMGLNINDGFIFAGSGITLPAALMFFQGNYIGGTETVAAAAPTNAYGFGDNFAHSVQVNDDWGPDVTTLRLGFVDVGFVGSINVATTKTLDSWTGALSGAGTSIAGDTGVIDQMIMFRAAGLLPQGGGTTVTNAYGLYVMPTLSAVATNSWGVYVADTVADNWMANNLVIGGLTGTPSNTDIALEVASQKAILMPILTTVQRNALTALEGMIIYNTTTNDVEFYDGVSWQGTVGTAFITAVSDTATIDLTVTGTTLSADVIDDSITNAKLANMATQTFKGRTTAGTGDPEDLTATQATAILNVMVGDSGAGGTKGLVPAPAIGDATRFLRGDATWATVPTSATVAAEFEWREGLDAAVVGLSSDNVQIGTYTAAISQYLYASFKVPQSYTAGNQIFLRMPFYSADSSGNVLFQTLSTLVRTGTDTIGSTTNQRTSTNSAVTLGAGTVNEPQAVNFDLTSATGQINGVAVSAGDVIKLRLTRGTDTATGVANALLDCKELTFA